MINWIEYYDYKYYLTEGVCNVQHFFISLSRMSFQPSKKYVSWLARKVVLVICYVIWLVICPIIKKIGDWWVIEITIFDKWLESPFFMMVQYPEIRLPEYSTLCAWKRWKVFHFDKSLNQDVSLWPHFGWSLSTSLLTWAEHKSCINDS